MTPEDTARVLAKCAAFDRRTVGRADILAWHEVLHAIPVEDGLAAVTAWYDEHRDWVMPSDIKSLALGLADQRRRAELRARIDQQQAALAAGPAVPTTDRKAEVQALLAELRDRLPAVDETKVRRREVVQWERARNAEPNPHYDPAALVGLMADATQERTP